jgi:hypothetical protein
VETGPTGQGHRRAGGGDVQPTAGIERVAEREEVVLVGAATVMEYE